MSGHDKPSNERVGAGRLADKPVDRRALLKSGGLALAAGLTGVAGLDACTTGSDSGGGGAVTITVETKNQFTTSGKDLGPAWDAQIKRFEKANPKITVKTVVLPVTDDETVTTQLSAGTAPELVIGQNPPKPYMAHPLDKYLKEKNPYAPEAKHWIDLFIPKYYGPDNAATVNPDGHIYFVNFNQIGWGLYVNKDAFKKAGVSTDPNALATWGDFQTAVAKLKRAGYAGVADDNTTLGLQWTAGVILNMMLAKYFDQWNRFDAHGQPGSNPYLTVKSLVWAIKTGKLSADLPEVAESFKLLNQYYKTDVIPNWSGITGTSGAAVNLPDFLNQKAAMTWGTDYAYQALRDASFDIGTIPFPTITTEDTDLSTNAPAQFGGATGFSTAYMVPAKISGDQLSAAIRFMQYMTAPKTVQPWISDIGALSAVKGVKLASITSGFVQGHWSEVQKMNGLVLVRLLPTPPFAQILQGYILGKSSLGATLQSAQQWWAKGATYQIKTNNWQSEGWAT